MVNSLALEYRVATILVFVGHLAFSGKHDDHSSVLTNQFSVTSPALIIFCNIVIH